MSGVPKSQVSQHRDAEWVMAPLYWPIEGLALTTVRMANRRARLPMPSTASRCGRDRRKLAPWRRSPLLNLPLLSRQSCGDAVAGIGGHVPGRAPPIEDLRHALPHPPRDLGLGQPDRLKRRHDVRLADHVQRPVTELGKA